MDPITAGLLVGGLMGGAKYAGNVAGNASDKQVAATTAKWSPWTGMKHDVRKANFAGDVLPAAVGGLALGASPLGASMFGSLGGDAVSGATAGGYAGANLGVDTGLGLNAARIPSSISTWDAALKGLNDWQYKGY